MTSNTSHSQWVRRICSVYKVLLCMYPKAFRSQFGPEMLEVFKLACRHAAANSHLVRFVLQMFWDVLWNVFAEWLAVLRTLQSPLPGWWLLALTKAASAAHNKRIAWDGKRRDTPSLLASRKAALAFATAYWRVDHSRIAYLLEAMKLGVQVVAARFESLVTPWMADRWLLLNTFTEQLRQLTILHRECRGLHLLPLGLNVPGYVAYLDKMALDVVNENQRRPESKRIEFIDRASKRLKTLGSDVWLRLPIKDDKDFAREYIRLLGLSMLLVRMSDPPDMPAEESSDLASE